MKKLAFISVLLLTVFISSCKKEEASQQAIQTQKIADVIPAKYLDTLRKLGIAIHEGTTPPNVEGIYDISPVKSKASNIPTDVIGTYYANAKIKFYDQNNSDFGIKLIGKYILNLSDSSISTAISGAGNSFTVYGKVRTYSGANTAVFGVVFSGEKDGSSIKNVEWGLINIDDSQDTGHAFIKEGQARLQYDVDFESGPLTTLRLASSNEVQKNTRYPAQP